MTNPTNATDAVQRVRRILDSRDLWLKHADYDSELVDEAYPVTYADIRALLARLADVEAENASLREDKARLDWLEANPRNLYPCQDGDGRWHIDCDGSSGYCSDTPRTAIDAARATEGTR